MGMLSFGVASGVAGEYLKQSDERRANEYQAIRDKRLAELGNEQTQFKADLTREENIRQEGVAAEGAAASSEFEAEQNRLDRASSEKIAGMKSPVKPGDIPLLTKSGDYTSWDTLRKDYEAEYTVIDQWGNKTTKEGAPSLTDYRNDVLDKKHELLLRKIEESIPEDTPEEEKPGLISQAYDYWSAKLLGGESGRGGMLTEGDKKPPKEEAKPAADPRDKGAPIVLSKRAQASPDEMYYELMDATEDEDYSEMEIVEYVRKHFNDPNWDIPLDR